MLTDETTKEKFNDPTNGPSYEKEETVTIEKIHSDIVA